MNVVYIESAGLFEDDVVLDVLSWGLIQRIKRTIMTDIPILRPLLLLITIVRVSYLKIIDDALLDFRFLFWLFLHHRCQGKFQTDL